MQYKMSEERIHQIIKEEVQRTLEEGLMQDLAGKARSTLQALTIAGAIGAGGMAQAAPVGGVQAHGGEVSASRHSTGDVTAMLADKINASGFKDRFGLSINVSAADPSMRDLGEATLELFDAWAHDDQTIQEYVDVTFEILKSGMKEGASPSSLSGYVVKLLKQKINKAPKKSSVTVSTHEFVNNPMVIQQATYSVYLDASAGKDIGPSLDKLTLALKRGVEDKDITRAEARKILKAMSLGPQKGSALISKILKLNK